MTAQRFEKFEGLGNDFVVVSVPSLAAFDASRVPGWCDRRFGIGADGVLVVLPSARGAAARMHVINADGSVPEMCGNGLRCVALSVADRLGVRDGEVIVETAAGLRRCAVARSANGESGVVEVEMGVVRTVGERAIDVAGTRVDLLLADAGNPHAIAYRDDAERDLEKFGLALATHPSFERGTNVEFVRWEGETLVVSVWERGVGRTLACGTGACAVVAVACARGEAPSSQPVRVRLPGGELTVVHETDTGQTLMVGPARRVFRGELA